MRLASGIGCVLLAGCMAAARAQDATVAQHPAGKCDLVLGAERKQTLSKYRMRIEWLGPCRNGLAEGEGYEVIRQADGVAVAVTKTVMRAGHKTYPTEVVDHVAKAPTPRICDRDGCNSTPMPKWAEWFFPSLAYAAAEEKDCYEGLEAGERLIAGCTKILERHGSARADALINRSQGYLFLRGDYARAIDDAKQALRGELTEFGQRLAYTRIGLAHLGQHQWALAIEALDESLRRGAQRPFPLVGRGVARVSMGDVAAGEADMAAARAGDPDVLDDWVAVWSRLDSSVANIAAERRTVAAAGRRPPSRSALEASVEAKVEALLDEGWIDDEDAFKHGLRAQGQTVADARQKANGWIRYLMIGPGPLMSGTMFMSFKGTPSGGALGAKARGDMREAYFNFFQARHALRHAVSPASNDANGDPAVLSEPLATYHAAPRTHYWRDRIDEDMRRMFETGVVPEGDFLRMYGIDTDSGPVNRPNQLPRPVQN